MPHAKHPQPPANTPRRTETPSEADAPRAAGENPTPRRMAELADGFLTCRDMFTALGDENRQLIFIALLRHWGGMRVGELTARTNLSRPAVSHHLKVLRQAKLVDMYEVGTKNFYFVRPELERWERLARLAVESERLVRDVTRRAAQNEGCPRRAD